MLTIKSKFGLLELEEEDVINFEYGVPGLEHYKRFVLLQHQENSPFHWLQALDDEGIALVVINPFLLIPSFEFELGPEDVAELELDRPDDAQVWVVSVLRQPLQDSTVNFRAPIIINQRARKGKQVILQDERYAVRQPLLPSKEG